MKQIALFLFSVCSIYVSLAQNSKPVESTAKSVTLYLRGVKEKRMASAQLNVGEQQILFTQLPQRLNPSTIRLASSEFVQIVSINHRLNFISSNEDDDMEIRGAKDSMNFYNDQILLKKGVLASHQSTRNMILSNKSVKGDKEGLTAEDVTELLDFYREKLNEINTKSMILERQLEQLTMRKNKFAGEYQKLINGKAKTFSELMVTIRTKQAGKANFSIEYFTPDAGWSPHYDIRNNESSPKLEITSHATLWQKTGFEWKNVDITLSTLDPQFNINAPDMQPQTLELGYYSNQYNQNTLYEQYKQQINNLDSASNIAFSLQREQGKFDEKNDVSQQLGTIPGLSNSSSAWSFVPKTSGPGTEYKIATPYTIASTGKDKKIEIERDMISANFKYKTVPKVEKAVFLMAVITGWDTLNYYPGNANIFNNGTFVGTVYLNTQTVQDTLEISLGQDKSFSVEYEVATEKTFTNNSGSYTKRGKGFNIRIMNKKQVDILLEIIDQAPLTSTQEVSIDIDKGDGILDPSTGFITWRRKIAGGTKAEVPISYSVKFPKENNLFNF